MSSFGSDWVLDSERSPRQRQLVFAAQSVVVTISDFHRAPSGRRSRHWTMVRPRSSFVEPPAVVDDRQLPPAHAQRSERVGVEADEERVPLREPRGSPVVPGEVTAQHLGQPAAWPVVLQGRCLAVVRGDDRSVRPLGRRQPPPRGGGLVGELPASRFRPCRSCPSRRRSGPSRRCSEPARRSERRARAGLLRARRAERPRAGGDGWTPSPASPLVRRRPLRRQASQRAAGSRRVPARGGRAA
jgi:hypothetical protein